MAGCRWEAAHEVDAVPGMYVLFGSGAPGPARGDSRGAQSRLSVGLSGCRAVGLSGNGDTAGRRTVRCGTSDVHCSEDAVPAGDPDQDAKNTVRKVSRNRACSRPSVPWHTTSVDAAALAAALVLGVASLAAHQDKLAELADDVLGDPPASPPDRPGSSFAQQRGVPAGPPAYRPAAAPKAD